MPDYTWYGFNRIEIHRNAPKPSGGVGIFVHSRICENFDIHIIDKSYDGILGIQFVHKTSEYVLVVYSCYLPPENSTRGRDAQGFYSHLLAQIYMNCDSDSIFIAADFNSRIGSLSDIINDIDTIPKRTIIDKSVNQHGHELLDFLNESKCCVLNGRFDSKNDNFTSISRKGKAVVDYMTVLKNV